MQILITGGGTGGHTYPAIAVASELRKRNPGCKIRFVGTKAGIESSAAPAAGFEIDFINAAGFSSSPARLLKFALNNFSGFLRSVSLIRKYSPNLVIGSGGFVSAPVLFAAKTLNVPYILLEQNVLPGKVNKLMAKWAEKVLASFEETEKYFPSAKFIHTGNPIRKEIIEKTREEAIKTLSLDPDKFTLIITGASQGARSVNNAVLKALPLWKDKGWQIIHLVGRKNYEEVKKASEPLLNGFSGEYRCIDYTEDMASIYAVTDLCIARAGASTLAEITARGIPAVLVPYPYAADNHQEKNARWIEKMGGAVVISDSVVEDNLVGEIIRLAEDKERLFVMAKASKSLGMPDALDRICKEIVKDA